MDRFGTPTTSNHTLPPLQTGAEQAKEAADRSRRGPSGPGCQQTPKQTPWNFSSSNAHDSTTIKLSGRLDIEGAEAIKALLKREVIDRRLHALIDMSAVDFMASLGMRLLVETAFKFRGAGTGMALFGLQPPVEKSIRLTGLDKVFQIASDSAEAARLLKESKG